MWRYSIEHRTIRTDLAVDGRGQGVRGCRDLEQLGVSASERKEMIARLVLAYA